MLESSKWARIKCFGKKEVMIKIGRKEYNFEVFVADVESPVLGWDFIRRNKLDIVWNEFGDNVIIDKVAKVSQVLEFKSIPHQRSRLHKRLSVSSTSQDDDFSVHFQVSAMQALWEEPPTLGTHLKM